jgi:hypothetical protein
MAKFAKQQVQPILYSYNVLKVATKDFHPSNKLGEGGFGAVYLIYNYKHGVCVYLSVCLSVFYLSFTYFFFSDVISLSLPLWRNPIGSRSLWSVLGGGGRGPER